MTKMSDEEFKFAAKNLEDQFLNQSIDEETFTNQYREILKKSDFSDDFTSYYIKSRLKLLKGHQHTTASIDATHAEWEENHKQFMAEITLILNPAPKPSVTTTHASQFKANNSNTSSFFSPSAQAYSAAPRRYSSPDNSSSILLGVLGVLGVAAMLEPIGWGVAALILAVSPSFFVVAAALYVTAIAACFIGAYALWNSNETLTDAKESSFAL